MIRLLYITVASEEEAIKIARILLAEKLIACANILGGSTSIYGWEGDVKQQQEVILFAKTTEKHIDKVIKRVHELHSYQMPCILALPVDRGFLPFMEWVDSEVA